MPWRARSIGPVPNRWILGEHGHPAARVREECAIDEPRTLSVIQTTILDQFEEMTSRDPDAVCLQYFGRDLDRDEVARASDGLAAMLREAGIGKGQRVVLALQNTPGFVMSLLGAWKLGAIVIPVNPMVRGPELGYVLRDSDARVVIASADMAEVVQQATLNSPTAVEAFWSEPNDFGGGNEIPFVGGDAASAPLFGSRIDESNTSQSGRRAPVKDRPLTSDVALICYTSGTTGPPKGAMISHANLIYQAETAARRFGLSEGDPVLTLAPMFHITGMAQHLALCLAKGLPMVLTHRFDPESVLHLIAETPPAFTVAAITAFIALASASEGGDTRLGLLTCAVSGGAPVPESVVRDLEDRFGFYVHNAYGMTETASATVGVPIGARAPVDPRSGALSIGQAYEHTTVRVVDPAGVELPFGSEGELVVAGPQVGLGYWGRPEETANTFQADGVHTGDAAVMDADGWVYIVDRLKDMVVVSGYKVWPREVEDVLFSHPDVEEAAVVGIPDDYRGETLAAYVVAREGSQPTAQALKALCRDQMSAYKCPTSFHFVDALPKTASGKVLRRKLAES